MKNGFHTIRYNLIIILCLSSLSGLLGTASAEGSWQTHKETGCKAWSFNPGKDTTFSWTGGCKDGYVDGFGTLEWIEAGQPGDKYIGQYLLGKEHGKGTFVWVNRGARYEGDFVNGLRSGKGIQSFADGERYEGEWRDDLPNGKGVQTWIKGARYEGDFVNGHMHGYGALTLKNGRVFRGRWENSNYLGP